jgi:hypothetical protein
MLSSGLRSRVGKDVKPASISKNWFNLGCDPVDCLPLHVLEV